MSSFTPGPWAVDPSDPLCIWEYDPTRIRSDRYIVPLAGCRTDAGRSWGRELQRPEAEANARLIASAPDLRAALVNLMTLVSPMVRGNKEFSVTWRKYEREARAAIAKAEGRDE